jgi:hypothetical protein
MDAHELIESMGKMIAAYDMLTSSVEVNQRAILDLAARLDAAEKRITELELASPCPMLKSICEDWEYDAKPSPDKQEMVPRPDPAEVRKALEKVKRLVKTQQKSCRRHGLTEEIVQAEADLLKLVGVEEE